jgi:hypothetical protein
MKTSLTSLASFIAVLTVTKKVHSKPETRKRAKTQKKITKPTKANKDVVGVSPVAPIVYKIGGWIEDDFWGAQIPFANLDFLNYGYLTCIQAVNNGPCTSLGQLSPANKPSSGLTNGARCVQFTIGVFLLCRCIILVSVQ